MINSQQPCRPFYFLLVLFLRYFLRFERESDVVVNAQVGIKRIALKDHRDSAFARRQMINDSAADKNLAGGGRFEAGNHPQQRGFAGAGRAEEDEELALLCFQIDVVYRS